MPEFGIVSKKVERLSTKWEVAVAEAQDPWARLE